VSEPAMLKQAASARGQSDGKRRQAQRAGGQGVGRQLVGQGRQARGETRRRQGGGIGDLMLIQSSGPLPEPPHPAAASKPFFAPALQDFTQSGSPPDILAVSKIVARDMVMMGFWYRFKYGFKVFAVSSHSSRTQPALEPPRSMPCLSSFRRPGLCAHLQELNNVDDRWVTASSCYFDMLANSYIMHLQTVLQCSSRWAPCRRRRTRPRTRARGPTRSWAT